MTTKLISLNVSAHLTLLVDGKECKMEWSMICPSPSAKQPYDVLYYLKEFLEEKMSMDIKNEFIPMVKLKRIKAVRKISQEQFNKKIKELGY